MSVEKKYYSYLVRALFVVPPMKERKILWRLVQSDIILDSALEFVIRIRRELKEKAHSP
jgi:hypothetical protein